MTSPDHPSSSSPSPDGDEEVLNCEHCGPQLIGAVPSGAEGVCPICYHSPAAEAREEGRAAPVVFARCLSCDYRAPTPGHAMRHVEQTRHRMTLAPQSPALPSAGEEEGAASLIDDVACFAVSYGLTHPITVEARAKLLSRLRAAEQGRAEVERDAARWRFVRAFLRVVVVNNPDGGGDHLRVEADERGPFEAMDVEGWTHTVESIVDAALTRTPDPQPEGGR